MAATPCGRRHSRPGRARDRFRLLVYVPSLGVSLPGLLLAWADRTGDETPSAAPAGNYGAVRVSPDGTRLAAMILGDGVFDVWIWRRNQGPLTRLTFDEAADTFPMWTPDSSHVVFASTRDGGGLFRKAADGTGDVERLLESPHNPHPAGWAPDGRPVAVLPGSRRHRRPHHGWRSGSGDADRDDVRRAGAGTPIRFLCIGSRICSTLPSDATSRWPPLRFANPSPPSGWVEDSHLQAVGHARHA